MMTKTIQKKSTYSRRQCKCVQMGDIEQTIASKIGSNTIKLHKIDGFQLNVFL
jgi:hypothetical protein